MWVASIADAIKSVNSTPSTVKLPSTPHGQQQLQTPRGAKVGADAGAGSIQANASLNQEQLKNLEPDVLVTLRIKQLKVGC